MRELGTHSLKCDFSIKSLTFGLRKLFRREGRNTARYLIFSHVTNKILCGLERINLESRVVFGGIMQSTCLKKTISYSGNHNLKNFKRKDHSVIKTYATKGTFGYRLRTRAQSRD